MTAAVAAGQQGSKAARQQGSKAARQQGGKAASQVKLAGQLPTQMDLLRNIQEVDIGKLCRKLKVVITKLSSLVNSLDVLCYSN